MHRDAMGVIIELIKNDNKHARKRAFMCDSISLFSGESIWLHSAVVLHPVPSADVTRGASSRRRPLV